MIFTTTRSTFFNTVLTNRTASTWQVNRQLFFITTKTNYFHWINHFLKILISGMLFMLLFWLSFLQTHLKVFYIYWILLWVIMFLILKFLFIVVDLLVLICTDWVNKLTIYSIFTCTMKEEFTCVFLLFLLFLTLHFFSCLIIQIKFKSLNFIIIDTYFIAKQKIKH